MHFEDLNDHPMAIFHAGEHYQSDGERRWLRFVKKVERLVGHSLDGSQDVDGYSLDFAHAEFEAGTTAEAYAAAVVENERAIKSAFGPKV